MPRPQSQHERAAARFGCGGARGRPPGRLSECRRDRAHVRQDQRQLAAASQLPCRIVLWVQHSPSRQQIANVAEHITIKAICRTRPWQYGRCPLRTLILAAGKAGRQRLTLAGGADIGSTRASPARICILERWLWECCKIQARSLPLGRPQAGR